MLCSRWILLFTATRAVAAASPLLLLLPSWWMWRDEGTNVWTPSYYTPIPCRHTCICYVHTQLECLSIDTLQTPIRRLWIEIRTTRLLYSIHRLLKLLLLWRLDVCSMCMYYHTEMLNTAIALNEARYEDGRLIKRYTTLYLILSTSNNRIWILHQIENVLLLPLLCNLFVALIVITLIIVRACMLHWLSLLCMYIFITSPLIAYYTLQLDRLDHKASFFVFSF